MNSITEEERARLQAQIDGKHKSYRRGVRVWRFLHYFSLYCMALFSVTAALTLKLDFTQSWVYQKDFSAINAGLAAVIAVLIVTIDFHRRWRVCRASQLSIEQLNLDLKLANADPKDVKNRFQKIIKSHDEAYLP